MTAGSPLPAIPVSVPDCDQETLLLILLLHWAATRRGHSPSASPGALSKGCPRSHRLLSLLRASSSPPVSAQSTAAPPQRAICSFLQTPARGWDPSWAGAGTPLVHFRGEITLQEDTHPTSKGKCKEQGTVDALQPPPCAKSNTARVRGLAQPLSPAVTSSTHTRSHAAPFPCRDMLELWETLLPSSFTLLQLPGLGNGVCLSKSCPARKSERAGAALPCCVC